MICNGLTRNVCRQNKTDDDERMGLAQPKFTRFYSSILNVSLNYEASLYPRNVCVNIGKALANNIQHL